MVPSYRWVNALWKLYHGGDESMNTYNRQQSERRFVFTFNRFHVTSYPKFICLIHYIATGSNLYIVNKFPNSRRWWHVIASLPLETDLTYDCFSFFKKRFFSMKKTTEKEGNNVMNWHLLFALVMEDKKKSGSWRYDGCSLLVDKKE